MHKCSIECEPITGPYTHTHTQTQTHIHRCIHEHTLVHSTMAISCCCSERQPRKENLCKSNRANERMDGEWMASSNDDTPEEPRWVSRTVRKTLCLSICPLLYSTFVHSIIIDVRKVKVCERNKIYFIVENCPSLCAVTQHKPMRVCTTEWWAG